jgi:uncharacterized protein (UPF0332 family)
MSKVHQDVSISYRLKRANKSYAEAILMEKEKHYNTCANRLYYACFYAVLALLEKCNESPPDGSMHRFHPGI